MPTDEEYKSYFIKRIGELQDEINALKNRVTQLEEEKALPSYEEAALAHSSQMSLGLSESNLKEKRDRGKIIWGTKR